MATEQFSNFPRASLNGAINNSVTSVTLIDGSMFPSVGNFRVIIDTEIMKVTARASNVLTVVRGQEGTAAAAHSDAARVTGVLTKEALDAFLSDNRLYNTYANIPAAGIAGRLYIPSDANIFAIDNGTSWKFFTTPGGFKTNLTPPVNSDFSWINQGGASVVTSKGGVILTAPAGAGTNLRCRYKAKTAPYKITMHFIPTLGSPTGSNYPSCGMGFYDGTKFHEIHLVNSGGVHYIETLKYTNATTLGTETSLNVATKCGSRINWFQIEDDNTNLYFRFSSNGVHWLKVWQESRTAFMGSGPTGAYFNACSWNTTWDATIHVLHWLEQ